MGDKIWTRAVWMEDQEEEGVVPTCWIEADKVRWPVGLNALRAMKEQRIPDGKWLTFDLIKIKHQSVRKEECDDYNITTTAELSEENEDEEISSLKRKKKKKTFPDFLSDSTECIAGTDLPEESLDAEEGTPNPPVKSADNTAPAIHGKDKCSALTPNTIKNTSKLVSVPKPPRKIVSTPQSKKVTGADKNQSMHSQDTSSIFGSPSSSHGHSFDFQRTSTPDVNKYGQRKWSSKSLRRSRSRSSNSRSYRSRSNSRSRRSHSRSRSQRSKSGRRRSRSRSSSVSDCSDGRGYSLPRPDIGRFVRGHSTSRTGRRENTSRSLSVSHKSRSKSRSRSRSSRSRSRPHHAYRNSAVGTSKQQTSGSVESAGAESGKKTAREQVGAGSFPLSEEKFQKRVLMLLTEIRDSVNRRALDRTIDETAGTLEFKSPLTTLEELLELEEKLRQEAERLQMKKFVSKLGGVDAADHAKKALDRLLHNALMAQMNITGKNRKFAFQKTRLYGIILESFQTAFPASTETKLKEVMSRFLKYAPERAGGGGRKVQKDDTITVFIQDS